MSGRALGTFPVHSPEWHAARVGRIGGSDIGVILGVSPYRTRAELLAEKAAELRGHVEPTPSTPRQALGAHLEAGIAAWWAEQNDVEFDDDLSAATYVHDEHGWALCNPDRITVDGIVVEVKTCTDRGREPSFSSLGGWGRAGTRQIPAMYEAQVEWTCGVLGLTEWRLVVLHGATNGRPDLDVATYRGKAQPAIFAALLRRGERFMADLHAATEAVARDAA